MHILISELPTELTSLSLQCDRTVHASRKYPKLSAQQQPWQSLSLLLGASPAKQTEGPDGQEQIKHQAQEQLCKPFSFQAREIGGL